MYKIFVKALMESKSSAKPSGNHSEGVSMQAASNDLSIDPVAHTLSITSQSESWDTVEVLEELLAHSIQLRDLYQNARWQTADIQYRVLRQLFDVHYKEQIRLVDVLIDRIRALNGAGGVFAGDFLRGTRLSQLLRGRVSATHLLSELVDAHESVLSAALPSGANDGQVNRSWTHDFAVGQVVLANDEQVLSVREQLMLRKRILRPHPTLD
jgi:starvation-inducible DNA-binding protein